jgi:hypothetical protein
MNPATHCQSSTMAVSNLFGEVFFFFFFEANTHQFTFRLGASSVACHPGAFAFASSHALVTNANASYPDQCRTNRSIRHRRAPSVPWSGEAIHPAPPFFFFLISGGRVSFDFMFDLLFPFANDSDHGAVVQIQRRLAAGRPTEARRRPRRIGRGRSRYY